MAAAAPDEKIHGHSSNADWDWTDAAAGSLALRIAYPAASPVAHLERIVTPDPDAAAVDIVLRIAVRADCRLPIGLHATFRLPAEPQAAIIEPGAFRAGRTFPGTVEPAEPLFAIDAGFDRLDAVPARAGGALDASRVPLPAATEELLQLDGVDGSAALAFPAEGWRVRLTWDAAHFPSLLLWHSNRGRPAAPWNGRHLALGMEPICSPFGLGLATALADNPIARAGTPTARALAAGEVFETRYRLAAEPI
jgi:hypothetical protein